MKIKETEYAIMTEEQTILYKRFDLKNHCKNIISHGTFKIYIAIKKIKDYHLIRLDQVFLISGSDQSEHGSAVLTRSKKKKDVYLL